MISTLKPFDANLQTDDSSFTNGQRAIRAQRTVEYYKVRLLGESGPVCRDDVTDLISDLFHWLHRNEYGDVQEAVLDAERNFVAETNGEGFACRECGEPCDNGEGWDGLCGNCADKKEGE